MLRRTLRLKTPAVFQKAFRFGRAFFFGVVGCRVVFCTGGGRKFGFVAAKKMFKTAVERNHARRILSEAVYSITASFPENVHIVLFFRSRPENVPFKVIQKDIVGLANLVKTAYFK
ncbi:MAG: ribonuclease P protein component [Candidatus Moranbacteria bacterium]|nr:ribonuclease P protein component [Candidatus Moranbacteria bacterium]